MDGTSAADPSATDPPNSTTEATSGGEVTVSTDGDGTSPESTTSEADDSEDESGGGDG